MPDGILMSALFERKLFKIKNKIKQNSYADVCRGAPTGLLGGSLFEREINQKLRTKINKKFIGVHRTAHFFLGSRLTARNLTESIQNQTESWGCMPDGILRGHAAREKTVQTEPKEQREQCELAQALPSRV